MADPFVATAPSSRVSEEQAARLQTTFDSWSPEQQELVHQMLALQLQQQSPPVSGSSAPAPPAPTVVPVAVSTRSKVPLPKAFSGKKTDASWFLFQLERVFKSMPHHYGTDDDKITAAVTLLTDKATNFLRPYTSDSAATPDFLVTWPAFRKEFIRQFFDPNEIASKTAKLDALRQTGSAQDYANTFLELVAFLDLSEQSKRQRFFASLKPRVQERILDPLDTDLFPSFEVLVEKSIRFDALLYNHSLTTRSSSATPRHVPPRSTPSSSSDAMDIDSVSTSSKGKSDKDRESIRNYRIANGLCTCCGERGHFIKDCSKATRYHARAATSDAPKAVTQQ
jgi:hypothetical protein